MGCAGAREKIEDQMMLMKLERMEVQMEKEKTLKKLSEMEGRQIPFGHVPDYIDPKFAKDRNIYDDEDDYKNAEMKGDNSNINYMSMNHTSSASEFQRLKLDQQNYIGAHEANLGITLNSLEEHWAYQNILLDYNILDFTSK